MLEKSETPISKENKLNHLTKYLSQEKAELLLLLLAKSNQNNSEETNMMRQTRKTGINSFPLSFNQEEFWILNKLQPECLALNLSSAYLISGSLNVDALEKVFNEILKRHENLRTTFRDENGTPMQYISPASPFKLPVIDMQGGDKEKQMDEVKRLLNVKTFEPFDFSNGPLIRISLIKLGEEEHVVWWGIHHIMVDGLGLTVLVKELKELYSYYAFNKIHNLPELEFQCSDYAVWQRKYYASNKLEEKINYWENQLSGYKPNLSLPADYIRPEIQTYNGAEQLFFISKSINSKLKNLSGDTGISLFMTLLSAFYLLTYYFTCQLDIVIGSPISQRNREELKNMICDFSNMLLYRTILSENDSLFDVMRKVKNTALGAYQNQELPSQELFNVLKTDADSAYSPLFRMMFVFHQMFPQEHEQFLEGLDTKYLNVERNWSQFDISLFMFDDDQDGLYGKFEYNTDLYAHDSILKFIHHFKLVLKVMVETPELKVSELSSKISSMSHLIYIN